MALVVNTNLAALNAQRNLNTSQSAISTSLQRLSSGLRINSAKDDAAGLAIVEGYTKQIRGNAVAVRNAADGISLGQTAESALGQVSGNIQRIRELAVQAANGSIGSTERGQIQKEVDQLTQELSRIIQTSEFNGTALLSATSSLTFQVGSDGTATNQVSVSTANVTGIAGYAASLSATGTVDVSTSAGAIAALSSLDSSITTISGERATFGAVQNRFEAVISNLESVNESLSASRSRLQDADFAAETANLTRAQILQQAGVSVLSQANTLPQSALALLQ
ncbi:MAG TPA: flagellin FliC [Gammaproteobacteria bacterium]|nr:flagellin FliC [Gammaproteobacteria bacterium]